MRGGGPAWSPQGARSHSRSSRATPHTEPDHLGPGSPEMWLWVLEDPSQAGLRQKRPSRQRSSPQRGSAHPGAQGAAPRAWPSPDRAVCPLSPFSRRPGASLPQPTFICLGTSSRDTFTLSFGGTPGPWAPTCSDQCAEGEQAPAARPAGSPWASGSKPHRASPTCSTHILVFFFFSLEIKMLKVLVI